MEQLTLKAYELGIDALNVTHPRPFTESLTKLTKLKEAQLYPDFVETNLKLRTDARLLLPNVKSIISTALAYKTVEPKFNPNSGILSRYVWGQDYHVIFSQRLEALAKWMQQHLGVNEYLVAVDTKPTIDRAVALRAGLGWLGQNCCVYVPNYGSWVFLGSILVDAELPITDTIPLKPSCDQNCSLCIKACPTNALYAPYKINPHICISYLTQMKGSIPVRLRPNIGAKLWGCDTCQQVCPENKKARSCSHSHFLPLEASSIPVIPLLNITKKEFRRRFSHTALGWRGKEVIQRNAAIVCGNLKLTEAVVELAKSIRDPKLIVRAASAWALGQIDTKKARELLAKSLTEETDSDVIFEIKQALANQ